jgi:hypothetical protein
VILRETTKRFFVDRYLCRFHVDILWWGIVVSQSVMPSVTHTPPAHTPHPGATQPARGLVCAPASSRAIPRRARLAYPAEPRRTSPEQRADEYQPGLRPPVIASRPETCTGMRRAGAGGSRPFPRRCPCSRDSQVAELPPPLGHIVRGCSDLSNAFYPMDRRVADAFGFPIVFREAMGYT